MSWNLAQSLTATRPPGSDDIPFKGYLLAWDPIKQAPAWSIEQRYPWNGGVLSTAGNLVVEGLADGRFVIYRADNGEQLWEMPIQTGAEAGPISYSVGGEQYIAVAAGWSGSIAITRWKDVPAYRAPTRILAFKLGGAAQLPSLPQRPPLTPPASNASAEIIAQGAGLFRANCRICHGTDAISGGMTPDLRYLSAETHAAFTDIVLGGARAAQGMPPFAGTLRPPDIEAIHAYLIDKASQLGERQ
jgi:quinohemoprotein ethanol dehydrogenase